MNIRKIFDGFALAVSMLSIIPFFKVHHFYKGINGYAVMFYPAVGFLLGSILYIVVDFLTPFMGYEHSLMVIFALWVVLTGALHLDGLSDTIDGLFVDKKRALEVMKDPHIGGMGMIFSVVFLMLKASALLSMGLVFLLPVILLLSRFMVVVAIFFFGYITPQGMGSLAKEEFSFLEFLIASAYVIGCVVYFDVWQLACVALGTMLLLSFGFTKRYGGFNGDMYGFSIEVVELVLLHSILVGIV